uniref:Uncharacterized protein n=1 Tax=Arion vulgaris TaxID=1028688 RepID=A0A0B7BNL8_9EUPU
MIAQVTYMKMASAVDYWIHVATHLSVQTSYHGKLVAEEEYFKKTIIICLACHKKSMFRTHDN